MSHDSRAKAVFFWNHVFQTTPSKIVDKCDNLQYEAHNTGDTFRVVEKTETLGNQLEHTYDLAGGVEDANGNVLTFASIFVFWVVNKATVTGDNLYVGGGPDPTGGALWTSFLNGSQAGLKLLAGQQAGFMGDDFGHPVTGGSADIVRVFNDSNNGNDIEYDLIVIGTVT